MQRINIKICIYIVWNYMLCKLCNYQNVDTQRECILIVCNLKLCKLRNYWNLDTEKSMHLHSP